MSEPLQRTHIAEESGLRVVLHAHPAINLALVHNGVPLITALEVQNTSDSDLIDVTVTVHLHGAGAELAPAWSRTTTDDSNPGASMPGRISRRSCRQQISCRGSTRATARR